MGQLSPDESQSPDYVHMIARLRYLDDNHEAAGLLWRQLLTQEGAEDQKFKSLIGIANVLYSEERFADIAPILEKLALMTSGVSKDEALSLSVLKGNYYNSIGEQDKPLICLKLQLVQAPSRRKIIGKRKYLTIMTLQN